MHLDMKNFKKEKLIESQKGSVRTNFGLNPKQD